MASGIFAFPTGGREGKMTSKDRTYFMLRAEQERQAARSSTNRAVRGRHEELAWLYQMRLDFDERPDLERPLMSFAPAIHIAA
jgi:hypothetical protein